MSVSKLGALYRRQTEGPAGVRTVMEQYNSICFCGVKHQEAYRTVANIFENKTAPAKYRDTKVYSIGSQQTPINNKQRLVSNQQNQQHPKDNDQ